MNTKLTRMPEDARSKLQETLERIINEGSGGLICIILWNSIYGSVQNLYAARFIIQKNTTITRK